MNIVFDVGGVLVTWQPREIAARVFANPESQELILKHFVYHSDWLELDRGTLAPGEAIARVALRTGLPESEVDRFLQRVPLDLVPIPESVALLYRLKGIGHNLYCLSNMPVDFLAHLEQTCPFWGVFSGRVFSCQLHYCKPEPEIYTHLLQTYHLDGPQTLFIDDSEVNLCAAARFGMRTIHFENPAQCEQQLRASGCL